MVTWDPKVPGLGGHSHLLALLRTQEVLSGQHQEAFPPILNPADTLLSARPGALVGTQPRQSHGGPGLAPRSHWCPQTLPPGDNTSTET